MKSFPRLRLIRAILSLLRKQKLTKDVNIETPIEPVGPTFTCEICKIDFKTKLQLTGHNMGRHKTLRCSLCNEIFQTKGKLGKHKINFHGYKPSQLGWGINAGWNKGKTQLEAFNVTGRVPHGNADFMNMLNTPEYIRIKMLSRKYHEDVVVQKEKELREKGYRTFCTSNYAHHHRIPDIIAISPEGKVVAIEMESIRRYKSSVESLRKRYTILLMKEGFFDDVIVEGFTAPKFAAQSSNTIPNKET